VCVRVYVYVCVCVGIYMCVCVCMRALLCMYVYMYVCMYVRTYDCMYVHSASYWEKKVESRTHETKQMTKAILADFIKVLKQIVQVLHHQKRRQAVSLLRFG